MLNMLLLGVLLACQAQDSPSDTEADIRTRVDEYYDSVKSVKFDELPKSRQQAENLTRFGVDVLKQFIADLQSDQLPPDDAVKAMFATSVFAEEGVADCEGELILALIELADHPQEDVRQMTNLLLESITSELFIDRESWRTWWETNGSKEFRRDCKIGS